MAMREDDIVRCLLAYNQEAQSARISREEQWRRNWDTYWQRHDFSGKAPWQYRLVMAEGPTMTERFVGAIKRALVQAGEWYTVEDPSGAFTQFIPLVKHVMDYWLSRAGETVFDGTRSFLVPFEECLRDGALSMMVASVTYKTIEREVVEYEPAIVQDEDPETGEKVAQVIERPKEKTRKEGIIAVEAVDPFTVWIDHTGRGLYRRRRIEMDLHELVHRAKTEKDEEGKPLWNMDKVSILRAHMDERQERWRAEQHGSPTSQNKTFRVPVVLDEYVCTILTDQGEIGEYDGLQLRNVYVVMANEKHIVRGPEPIPFLHGQDWLVHSPMVRLRGAPYGRSYVEVWEAIVRGFTDFTNQILDSAHLASMNAYVGDPTVLEDVEDLSEGIHGGKYFKILPGHGVDEFISQIPLGQFPGTVVEVWRALKAALQEGAQQNELFLGNLPQRGERTATEISSAMQNASAFVAHVAQSVELWLEAVLSRIWWTALQHMDEREMPADLVAQLAPFAHILAMPYEQRLRFLSGPYRFNVRGITGVMERTAMVQSMLGAFGVLTRSRELTRALLHMIDPIKLVREVLHGFGVRVERIVRDENSLPVEAFIDGAQAPPPAVHPPAPHPPPQGDGGITVGPPEEIGRPESL